MTFKDSELSTYLRGLEKRGPSGMSYFYVILLSIEMKAEEIRKYSYEGSFSLKFNPKESLMSQAYGKI